jgi:hypothetical protein
MKRAPIDPAAAYRRVGGGLDRPMKEVAGPPSGGLWRQ